MYSFNRYIPGLGVLAYRPPITRRPCDLGKRFCEGGANLSYMNASVEAGLAFEAEAAFGNLALAGVGFHPVDPDIRACIGADVSRSTHLPLTFTPSAFLEMAAILPDCQPCAEIEIPFDAPPLRRLALLKEALEEGR